MKPFVLLLAGFLFNPVIYGQEFPGFGKPSSQEFNMKTCSFDPEADAVILLHEAVSTYNDDYNLITNHHVRIKILKDKGIDASNISIPFYREGSFEYVHVTEGLVINQIENGGISSIPLDKKSIYSKNVSKYMGEVSFAFPSVKVGSIIEYKYQSTMKHYGGLRDWYFQDNYPVVTSRYMLHILPNHEFAYSVVKNNDWPVDIKPEPQLGRIEFSMVNIPGLDPEPYMDSHRDNLQRVAFQLSGTTTADGGGSASKRKFMTSWAEVIKELSGNSNFGSQLDKDLAGTSEFLKTTKAILPEMERMKVIYDYVRKNMKWDGYKGIYTDRLKAVWNKKAGTQGEMKISFFGRLGKRDLMQIPC